MTTTTETVPAAMQKVTPVTPAESGAHFGFRMSIWGNMLVTGAWPEAHFVGAAYVIETVGWSQLARLENPEPVEGAAFGTGVSIWGDFVLVGRLEYNFVTERGPGSAFMFKRGPDGSFVERARLTATDGMPETLFGSDVAVYENCAAVGAPLVDEFGAVFVFRTDDDWVSWTQTAKIVPTEPHSFFGLSLAIDSSFLVVAAADRNVLSSDHLALGNGAVFAYTHTGEYVVTLEASDGAFGDEFGADVSLGNDLLVVGAPRHRDGGAAYAYNTTTWDEVVKLNSTVEGGSYFGRAVDVDDNSIVVGSNLFGLLDGDPGCAEVFISAGNNGSWHSLARIEASTASDFGNFVASGDDGLVVVSAVQGLNDNGVATGAIYVYEFREDATTQQPTASSKSNGGNSTIQVGLVLALVGLFVLLGGVFCCRRRRQRIVDSRIGQIHIKEDDVPQIELVVNGAPELDARWSFGSVPSSDSAP